MPLLFLSLDSTEWAVAAAIMLLLCGGLGAALGGMSGKAGIGFVLGFLFGPLGVIAAAIVGIGGKNRNNGADPLLHHYSQRGTVGITLTTSARPAIEPIKEVPSKMTVAREGEILGTWLYADVLDYLSEGRLSPSDIYHDKKLNRWLPLESLLS